jgi:hypothetical protein
MPTLREKFLAVAFAITIFACSALSLSAQSTTSATCTTPPTSVTALSFESVVQLNNILTVFPPNIPANVIAAITSGAQQLRGRVIYNPAQGTVTTTVFVVAPGSPNPTPLSIDITQQTIVVSVLQVDRVYIACTPTPSIMFVGTISGSSGIFGNFNGAPGAISFGYTTDNPPSINNVTGLAAGQGVIFSPSGTGALPGGAAITFPAAPVTSPTSAGAPMIVINPTPVTGSLQVFFNPYHVDASQSSDPNKLALTYMWSSDKPVNFQPSNKDAAPNIQFGSGAGDYTITLTITNSAGVSSTTKFVLTYIGQQ